MSGGSFDYLYASEEPRHSLVEQMLDELEDLASEGHPGAVAAVAATRPYLHPDREDDPVREVWRAVEWWRSGDWGKNQVVKALAAFAARPDPEDMPPSDRCEGQVPDA